MNEEANLVLCVGFEEDIRTSQQNVREERQAFAVAVELVGGNRVVVD